MSNLETIRAAIGATMKRVPAIGIVQPYERYAKAESDFRAFYQVGEEKARQIRGWLIRRGATRQTAFLSTQVRVEHDWKIRGFLGVQDDKASEIVMDDLVEKLVREFRLDLTLGGTVEARFDTDQPVGLQLAESGPVMFAGVLCHGVSLDLTTRHYESAIPAEEAPGLFKIFHANWDIPEFGNVQPPLPADATADATDHVEMETN